MNPQQLAARVRAGEPVSFEEVMAVVAQHYRYRPCRFRNGLGRDPIVNEAGTNEGSCRVLYLGRLLALSETHTLELFGDYYRRDVLGAPNGTDHANIRRFMRDGWAGVDFDDVVLEPKSGAEPGSHAGAV